MIVDATHARWLGIALGATALAGAGYVARGADAPARFGGTPIGIGYGAAAAAMILFAGLLGARRKVLLLRVGSMAWWMKGHLWLGLTSLPLALFHAGFQGGGPLTTGLLWLLFAVVALGVLGAALQHVLPGVMSAQCPDEKTYAQIPRRIRNCELEAYDLVAEACGPVGEARRVLASLAEELTTALPPSQRGLRAAALLERFVEASRPVLERADRIGALARALLGLLQEDERPRLADEAAKQVLKAAAPVEDPPALAALLAGLARAFPEAARAARSIELVKLAATLGGLDEAGLAVLEGALVAGVPEREREGLRREIAAELAKKKRPPAKPRPEPAPLDAGKGALRDLYVQAVMPFLREPGVRRLIGPETRARIVFDGARAAVPEGLRGALDRLEEICADVRAMQRQRRLHAILHAWIPLHIAPSLALVVLLIAHAAMALYY